MAHLRDGVMSHTSQPVATSQPAQTNVLPPFSGKLKEDKRLILSHQNFKESIQQFYANKQLSAIDQIKATSPYPTSHVLAQFASMAYHDCTHEVPKPPAGWQLLTTASNTGDENGYFGTAYWHSEHQQVVIAHRGTDIKNFGALVTDVKGVLFNNYVEQMSSASTFANKVVTVLQEIEKEKNVSFELFFTGHSLGGWLAQITTFTTEYLEVKRGTFLKRLKTQQGAQRACCTVQDSHDVQQVSLMQNPALTFKYIRGNPDIFLNKRKLEEGKPPANSTAQFSQYITHSYHAHTVVFDSPGCEKMLVEMKKNFDVRHNRSSIDVQYLDITSYLSAPNLINTCNSHLGTVYRIFTDLSDMGFLGKHTPLYNLATHSMDKIVQTFDPKTGQVSKDTKGKPKIREVVDWPVSSGLTYGPELDEFFKWAEHHNNYHPEVTDTSHSKVPNGYQPFHYQTKAYNERTKSLSVFTQDEREFLERYRWLRRLPEFFKSVKSLNMFSVMSNTEAETESEQKLQNFEIDNESVRCPDASTLHSLIPFVKRLVRHFPHIKEVVKEKLSSAKIKNRVYQYETQRYVEKIRNSTLDFNHSALVLRKFLTSDQQICQLQITDGDAWTGITKVYQFLQNTFCTSNYSSEGHYTILKLQRLLTVNRMINLNALLPSMETPHLLMIACGTNQRVNDELRDMFEEMFSILKQKDGMKIILTTQSEDDTADFIQQIASETLDKGFITTHEKLAWSDLTASSQSILLEKTVIFQGRSIALNQLTSAESMTDSFPLADLLKEKELKIGEELVSPVCSGYNEKYYIDRTFNHNIVIRQGILNDERARKFADLLARTEKEFKQLCQQNPTRNVHWLENDNSGELIWQQSQGNLQTLRKYIDNQKSHSYAASDLDKLLQQARNQRVMLIAAKAGMGKTTVLTYLSKRIKQKYPAHWLVWIDLNDYTELFEAQKVNKMDKGRVLEFVSKEVLKLESRLEKKLFKKSFEGNETTKVVVMVEAFDEICPKYKETVIDMLQVLKKQTSLEQLWVTTRPHMKEELEDNLQQLSYTLQPFSEEEQVEFLKKFWLRNSNLEAMKPHRLEIYAQALIRKLAQSISDKDKEFTGIPLQIHMLAETFEEGFRSFKESDKTQPELPQKLELLELYGWFIERKCDIYYREKPRTPAGNLAAEDIRERDFKIIKLEHQLLALQALFPEDQVKLLQIDHLSEFSNEEIARIGIVQKSNEGKPQFIHRTFAEYFVVEFLINQLIRKTKQHTQVQEFLLNKVLLRTDCQVIRAFLDGQLENSEPSVTALEEVGKKLDEQWKEREKQGTLTGFTTALHEAAKEDNGHIIGFLLESLESGENFSTVTKMLLHEDRWGQTVWHKAAENDSVQALKKIWEWAEAVTAWQEGDERGHLEASDTSRASVEEEELLPNHIKNSLFVAKDQYGNTAWHGAAQRGSSKALETLWMLAKEAGLKPRQLLLAENKEGNTAWQVAVKRGNFEILEKIWDWAKKAQINRNDLKDKFLQAKDKNGYTVWNRAAESGSLETLQTLWDLGKKLELKADEMFLAQGTDGNTAWQVAAQRGHFEVLKKLWEWAKGEKMGGNVLKDRLLLAKDQDAYTAWHRAAERGNLQALETLWNWVKEVKLHPNELLLARSYKGLTAWHLAADRDHFEAFKKMWEWAQDAQKSPNDLKKELFLDEDNTGYTVWHRAAQRGTLPELETLWSWAKSENKPRRNVASPK